MTEGSPGKLIFFFAIPLMLGNMCQQLYTVVDTLVVSRTLGVQALAAMGSADWYMFMVPGIIMGFTQGFAILIANFFGASDNGSLNRAIAHSIRLSGILAIILTALAILSVPPVLALLRTPSEIRPLTRLYLTIYFAGIPAIVLYNLSASVLRAFGNSKVPLYAMIGASVMNIGLDILFVVPLKMGIAGAALATVIAQLCAGLFCTVVASRIPEISLTKEDFGAERNLDKELLRLSTPMVLQNILISIGGMIVGYVVNGLGVTFIAGYTATNKLYGMLEVAAVAYGFAIVTYTGQNYGAARYDRIRQGFKASLLIAVLTSAAIGGLMILFGRTITGAFLTGSGPEVEEAKVIAYRYLVIMAGFLWILYVLYVVRSMLQGMGNTLVPMISGGGEFIARTLMALVGSLFMGGTAIMIGEVAAWAAADIVMVPALIKRIRQLRKLPAGEKA